MTHRDRMLKAARGEMADRIPFAPRLDLWYTPNKIRGTLPPEHKDHTIDEISRAEGWAFHKIVPEFMAGEPEEILDRGLNIYRVKECPYRAELPDNVERTVTRKGNRTKVQYRTPIGSVGCVLIYTEEMRAAGATLIWLEEHILKRPEDYKILGYIYRNMKIIPDYPRLQSWINSVGEEGLACAQGSPNASPLHLIQRDLLDATQFYYHFRDYPKEMTGLVEDLEPFFERILAVTADSPAEVIQWGANYDDMITYPALFREHFLPWLRKASAVLKQKGKIPLSHCDGENLGLMDLIHESGIGIAESVCPYPMTKVALAEYYRRWRPQITIFGGIPANLLLEDSASDEDFEKYMDLAFRSIVPGDHFIFGVADTVPPNAKFERLRRIGRWVEERGNLPLQAGDVRVLSAEMISRTGERVSPVKVPSKREFPEIREALAGGDQVAVQALVKKALEEGISAGTILQKGLIPAMESIGERFKEGEIFIPEVLLSARAMNEGLTVLEPFLAESGAPASGTILIGTVRGDMHDIGKNLVSVMLKGVGFKVHDLGVDVPNDVFVQKTREIHPDVLALSALLTTTMPHMQEVIAAIKRTGLREKVKIIIGGAPVNQTFANSIGADGYGGDAGDAVALVKRLLDL